MKYYDLEQFISAVPDTADVSITITQLYNKRRLDIIVSNNYDYRIYLDDYFSNRLLAIIDDRFGCSLSSNSNCLYGNVTVEGHNIHNIKARLTHLRKFKIPKKINVYDMLEVTGWDDIKWASKFLK